MRIFIDFINPPNLKSENTHGVINFMSICFCERLIRLKIQFYLKFFVLGTSENKYREAYYSSPYSTSGTSEIFSSMALSDFGNRNVRVKVMNLRKWVRNESINSNTIRDMVQGKMDWQNGHKESTRVGERWLWVGEYEGGGGGEILLQSRKNKGIFVGCCRWCWIIQDSQTNCRCE